MSDYGEIELARTVSTGVGSLAYELRIKAADLSLRVTGTINVEMCIQLPLRRHCFTIPQSTSMQIEIHHGEPCTASITTTGSRLDTSCIEAARLLREMISDWSEAIEAVDRFLKPPERQDDCGSTSR